MTAPLAQCRAVTRRFGQLTAVNTVSLDIHRGEIVGLLGANGAGKTTLIRMLLGLLPATGGEIRLFGENPSRATRARIGYVPQGLGLYADLTGRENLEFSAAVFGAGDGAREPATADQRVVAELPLGAQRRLAFTQALAHRPDLLILDEPTSGVDPLGRARLWETIAAAAEAGAGVLVTTHYMDEAGECSKIVIMADGAVVAEGTASEIIGGARVTVAETPSWAAAFEALEEAGLPAALAGRRLRVPGVPPHLVRRALTGLNVRLRTAPATLEERFFTLTQQRAAG
jgi:ABC-2 type transport system ATP-binding protein